MDSQVTCWSLHRTHAGELDELDDGVFVRLCTIQPHSQSLRRDPDLPRKTTLRQNRLPADLRQQSRGMWWPVFVRSSGSIIVEPA